MDLKKKMKMKAMVIIIIMDQYLSPLSPMNRCKVRWVSCSFRQITYFTVKKKIIKLSGLLKNT